jgi:hypothetical protein
VLLLGAYNQPESTSNESRGRRRAPRLGREIGLRRSTSTLSGKRRRPWLKFFGWAAVAALSCFLIAVAAGLISDNIDKPKARPAPFAEPERVRNGWGEPSSFVGQYDVNFMKPVGPTRSNDYSELASAGFTEGHLTMFMREVYEHRPHVPGGVLVLNGSGRNLVVYLSELSSNGRVLYATIKGGTYEGPAIGSFGGVRRGNRILGGLRLRSLPNVEANFVRYSRNPSAAAGPTGTGAGANEGGLGE